MFKQLQPVVQVHRACTSTQTVCDPENQTTYEDRRGDLWLTCKATDFYISYYIYYSQQFLLWEEVPSHFSQHIQTCSNLPRSF